MRNSEHLLKMLILIRFRVYMSNVFQLDVLSRFTNGGISN